ncbi:MAG: hypothetical protein KatS3mg105_5136 [Gemmatales bacterium]|nr:MAG: hypothetical protein KatS3mg105_5136 [Gemmatales bacterium]GIW97853.1 MAG: hypothetical protein KatS3mg111_1186 [Pirellulaceae bacterium]
MGDRHRTGVREAFARWATGIAPACATRFGDGRPTPHRRARGVCAVGDHHRTGATRFGDG